MERKYWWYSVATSSSSNLDSDKCNKTSIKPGASPGRSLNNRHVTNLVCSIGSDPVRPALTKHQAAVGFIMFDVLLSYLILSPGKYHLHLSTQLNMLVFNSVIGHLN